MAQKHFKALVKEVFELTGIPGTLNLNGAEEDTTHGLSAILQKEASYQQETLKLLERAIEVFGEEQELADQLTQIRKDLLESKKRMKHMGSGQTVEKMELTKTTVEKTTDKAATPKAVSTPKN